MGSKESNQTKQDNTNKTSTTLINADQTKTGQKTWLVPIVSLMDLSCSGPNTLALLNKQLSKSSFSLFFSCHVAPFLDKCFFYQTNTCHRLDTYLLEFEDYLPHHNKNKQDQTLQNNMLTPCLLHMSRFFSDKNRFENMILFCFYLL